MKKIQLIATDLDGTLLNSDLKVSRRNVLALQRMKEDGCKIVLCTGRPFKGMEHLIGQLGLNEYDFTVTYNGSLVQTCDGKHVLHQARISPLSFWQVSTFFKHFGVGVHAMTIDKIYTYNKEISPLTVRESYLGNLHLSVLEDTDRLTVPIIKLMAVGDPNKIDEALPLFRKIFSQEFSTNKSEAFYLEIMQKGDDKAVALQMLLDYLDFDSDKLLAFGNNVNDLAMLNLAGIGVAVSNAVSELKESSDYVTASNDDDGVAQFLEKYFIKSRKGKMLT